MAAVAASGGLSLFSAETANAVVPTSQHFVFGGDGDNPVWRKTLHQPYWAMQSFAYDHVYGHIYFVQTKVGSTNGDLWMTRTDLSGNVLGAMAIHKFDHGSSMGIEPDEYGSPYVWLAGDWESPNADGSDPNSHRIARFKYSDGGDLDYFDHPGQYLREFSIGLSNFVDCPRPAIDPYTNRLLLRYMGTTTPWRIALFDLSAVLSSGISDDTPILAKRALPANDKLNVPASADFQGITSYGQYVYLSYGAPPSAATPDPGSYLVRLDMNKSGNSYEETFATTAGASLPGREPQGMAIWRSSSGPRLAFGFSSKISGSPAEFEASVFYKSQLTG
jgi:hypothetical protein